MTSDFFAHAARFASNLPAPKARGGGSARYNFGVGHNDPSAVPVAALSAAAAAAITEEGESLAIYNLGGSALGHEKLRRIIADKLNAHRGFALGADEVLITSGSLQGMDLVNALLCDRGDCVIIEQFTYGAAISKARSAGVDAIPAVLDEGGIVIEALRETLERLAAEGRRPKYIYTIPTVQNPTGTIMPLERRKALLALAAEFDVPIYEDECYADLIWSGEAPPALAALSPEQVIHIGSLSKSLAPALRLGYMVAPWQALGQILALKTDAGTGAIEQMTAARYLDGHFDAHVETLTRHLETKLDAMMEAIGREFGTSVEVVRPTGGLFVWMAYPEGIDTAPLVKAAAEEGISVNAGSDWSVDPEHGRRFVRLCFALPSVEDIEAGIAAFAEVSHKVLGMPERSGNMARRGTE
ncbi:PLP-dependent aminotransferase family protein [Arsenicitalea aurantiaca]|uniref:PLP-dependent aminotransferase family protein n=1 Tax=Arsenicitalea aurantiaca TaxID=1783274 RepID=A0A433X7R2_9HYPH|nr:PLP-dependent aminotransferase family protein [Arsenicitalea aurantiaca]RUT30092.1 PLP-dependent aminotransferase family protein [Arsenicitalea aurantiaca]